MVGPRRADTSGWRVFVDEVMGVDVGSVEAVEEGDEGDAAAEDGDGAEEPEQEGEGEVEAAGAGGEEVAALGEDVGDVVGGDADGEGFPEGHIHEEVDVVDVADGLHVGDEGEEEARHEGEVFEAQQFGAVAPQQERPAAEVGAAHVHRRGGAQQDGCCCHQRRPHDVVP